MKKPFFTRISVLFLALICTFMTSCNYAGLTLPSTQETVQNTQNSSTNSSAATASTSKTTATTTNVTTDISQRLPSPTGIQKITYLDFSNSMNKWAERDENGDLIYTRFTDKDLVDENGNVPIGDAGQYYPHALYLENNSYNKNLEYRFIENGEILKLRASATDNPGIAFEFNVLNTLKIGEEKKGCIEFVKIRFKNKSSATRLTFMGTSNIFGAGKLDPRIRATVSIIPNSDEWQTITLSMIDGTFNTTGNIMWGSYLKRFAIFPFGYGNDCEATIGAEMEIDYVVLGSYDYVTAYQSELEKSAE